MADNNSPAKVSHLEASRAASRDGGAACNGSPDAEQNAAPTASGDGEPPVRTALPLRALIVDEDRAFANRIRVAIDECFSNCVTEVADSGVDAGANTFLAKPVGDRNLVECIERCMC